MSHDQWLCVVHDSQELLQDIRIELSFDPCGKFFYSDSSLAAMDIVNWIMELAETIKRKLYPLPSQGAHTHSCHYTGS